MNEEEQASIPLSLPAGIDPEEFFNAAVKEKCDRDFGNLRWHVKQNIFRDIFECPKCGYCYSIKTNYCSYCGTRLLPFKEEEEE